MVSLRPFIALCVLLAASAVQAQTSFPSFSSGGINPRPAGAGSEPGQSSLYLSAVFAKGDTQPVRGALKWRIFEEAAQPDGSHKLVAQSSEAAPLIALPDGSYLIHASFGLAGATSRVDLRGQSATERLVLNAGALKITGMLGDNPIPTNRQTISIFVPERGNSEAKLVVSNARAGDPISLPEGTYHLVSTLYDITSSAPGASANATNSVVTADLRIQPGKLTEATLRHRAATMTLKLVNAPGSEALANTNFSVLTPGGDVIRELIGAFPALVLSEGEYVAIARHEGKTYQSVFKVQSTLDRDVEVVAK